MPSHTAEEQARNLQENRSGRRRKGRTPKRSRVTGGNQTTGKLRQTFQTARKAVRGGANVAGQVGRAVTQEVAGLGREVGRGLLGKGATAAGGGAQEATRQTTANRLAARARRAFGGGPRAPAAPTAVPSSATGPATARAAATQSFEAGQRGGRGIRAARTVGRGAAGVGRLARGLALPAAAATIGTEALTTTQAEQETASGLPQVTPLRGTGAPGTGPQNLERFGDPLLAAARPAIGVLRGAFGLGADQDISPTGEPIAPTPAAAGVRAPQFGAEGERSFTNADIGGGAANRGLASVEENQAVAGRLEARGVVERQAGLRAAAQRGVGGAAEADPAATALARQASGGGLASAFGALNLSGNQLRRQAAERTRASDRGIAATDASNKLNLELTKIGAQSQVDRQKNFSKDTISLTESLNSALEGGDEQQIANIRGGIFKSALENPQSAAGAAAKTALARVIGENTETSFFGALLSINPFTGGRGLSDAVASIGQGGLNNEFQQAVDKLVLNESTGDLQIANPDGSGGLQFVVNISDLPPDARDFISQGGLRQPGEGDQITRGDPNRQDPSRPSLRS